MTSSSGSDPRFADRRLLDRVERFGLAWTGVGALAFVVAGRPVAALVLTLTGLASMVSFRGLRAFVGSMGPEHPPTAAQGAERPSPTPEPSPATDPSVVQDDETDEPSAGRRSAAAPSTTTRDRDPTPESRRHDRPRSLTGILRLLPLGLILLGTLVLAPSATPGLLAGVGVLPAALLSEAARATIRAFKSEP